MSLTDTLPAGKYSPPFMSINLQETEFSADAADMYLNMQVFGNTGFQP